MSALGVVGLAMLLAPFVVGFLALWGSVIRDLWRGGGRALAVVAFTLPIWVATASVLLAEGVQ